MSQRKVLLFSTRALYLLLPLFGVMVIGELSENFSKCRHFFYKGTPPQGITTQYQEICQSYKHKHRFASLYHSQHRTPLYSAYVLSSEDGKRPRVAWMYEPQLAFPSASSDMRPFPVPKKDKGRVMRRQAVLEDYKFNKIYTRGHLNPSMHQTVKDRPATFTLTNIVPQQKGSNEHTWKDLETEVKERSKKFCKGLMHVITGVMPFESGVWLRKRVSVPEYMWSAYCCPSYSDNLTESVRHFFPTYAAVGRNNPNSGDEIVPVDPEADTKKRGYDVRQMPLKTLESILRERLKMPISLFEEQCQ